MSVRTDEVNLKISINGEAAGQTMKEIRSEAKALRAQIDNLKPGTQEFIDASQKLQAVNAKYKSLNDEVRGVSKATSVLGDTFKGVLAAFSFEKVIDQVIDFGKESMQAFKEAELNANKLKFAINNIAGEGGGSFDRIIKLSEEWQKKSMFSDDSIQQASTALVQYGLTTKQVEALIPKVIDLASAQGTDLASATDKVISGINGQSKALKDAGISFEDTGSKTENMNIVMDKLGKFTGAAGEAMETAAGQSAKFANEIDDVQEKVGQRLVPVFEDMRRIFWDALEGFTALFDKMDAKTEVIDKQKKQVEEFAKSYEKLSDAQLKNQLSFVNKDITKLLADRKEAMANFDDEAKASADAAINSAVNEREAIKQLLATKQSGEKIQDDLTKKGQSDRDAANAKYLENTKKLEAELAQVRADAIEDDMQRELASLAAKYQNKQKEIKGTIANEKVKNDLLKAETEKYETEKAKIQDKYWQEAIKEADRQSEELGKNDKKDLEERLKTMQKVAEAQAQFNVNEAQQRVNATRRGTELRYQAEQELALREKQLSITKLDLTKDNTAEMLRIEQDYTDKLIGLAEKETARKKELKQQGVDAALEAEKTILDTIQKNQRAETDFKLKNLKKQLDDKKITQKEYEQQERQLRYDQAVKEKEQAVFQATIDGIVAVVKAFSTGGPIAAAIMGALVAVKVGALIAEPVPAFAAGGATGTFAPGGSVQKPTLGLIGEKGSEWVAPNWMLSDPVYADVIGMLEQARVRGYASGGITGQTATQKTTPTFVSTSTQQQQSNEALTEALNKNNEFLQHLISHGVEATFDFQKYEKGVSTMAGIKKAASIGS